MKKILVSIALGLSMLVPGLAQEFPSESPEQIQEIETLDDYVTKVFTEVYGHFLFEKTDRISLIQFIRLLQVRFELDLVVGNISSYLISSSDGKITVFITGRGQFAERTLVLGLFDSNLIFLSNMTPELKEKLGV